jgi:hypothetical protein
LIENAILRRAGDDKNGEEDPRAYRVSRFSVIDKASRPSRRASSPDLDDPKT